MTYDGFATWIEPINMYLDFGKFLNDGFIRRLKVKGDAMAATNGKVVEEEKKVARKVDVEFHGEKVVLPEDMSYEEALEAIARQRDEESQVININEVINAFPMDGVIAFQKALKEIYGWANLKPTEGFFGKTPPTLVAVDIAYGETIQVPWGSVTVPKIDGSLSTGWGTNEKGVPVFRLHASIKKKDQKAFTALVLKIREILARESIYRGQAIKLNFRDTDGERQAEFSPSFAPKFIDMTKHAGQKIVYPAVTKALIQSNLLNPVIHAEKCRKHGIPLKRGVLLEGRYGTGKTLTAHQLAQTCIDHNWTFLYLEDVRDLDMAVAFAKLYSPCVLFAEDVDRTMPNGPRTPEIDKVLNTLDGIESKHLDVLTVLTTNHVGNIHPGFLRPGRIDSVIQIMPPDDAAMVELIRYYGGDLIEGTDEEFTKSLKGLRSTNAAFVREAVEKAKLSAISSEDLKITPHDIEVAVASMKTHLALVCPDAGTDAFRIEEGDEVIDPARMAVELLTDQFAGALLHKIANPKTLEKIIIKTMKPRRGGNPSNN